MFFIGHSVGSDIEADTSFIGYIYELSIYPEVKDLDFIWDDWNPCWNDNKYFNYADCIGNCSDSGDIYTDPAEDDPDVAC